MSVERVFSGGGDLITKRRCSLKKDTIRACMCLKDWIKDKRIKNLNNNKIIDKFLYMYEFFFVTK